MQIEELYLSTFLRLLNAGIAIDEATATKLQERVFHFVLESDRFVAPLEMSRQREQLELLCHRMIAALAR